MSPSCSFRTALAAAERFADDRACVEDLGTYEAARVRDRRVAEYLFTHPAMGEPCGACQACLRAQQAARALQQWRAVRVAR